jgi:hypothetical protein
MRPGLLRPLLAYEWDLDAVLCSTDVEEHLLRHYEGIFLDKPR